MQTYLAAYSNRLGYFASLPRYAAISPLVLHPVFTNWDETFQSCNIEWFNDVQFYYLLHHQTTEECPNNRALVYRNNNPSKSIDCRTSTSLTISAFSSPSIRQTRISLPTETTTPEETYRPARLWLVTSHKTKSSVFRKRSATARTIWMPTCRHSSALITTASTRRKPATVCGHQMIIDRCGCISPWEWTTPKMEEEIGRDIVYLSCINFTNAMPPLDREVLLGRYSCFLAASNYAYQQNITDCYCPNPCDETVYTLDGTTSKFSDMQSLYGRY